VNLAGRIHLPIMNLLRDNRNMGLNRYSKRRRSLARQDPPKPGEPDLLIRMPADVPDASPGQAALSIPNAEPSLGERLQPFFEACGGMQPISLVAHRWDAPAAADRHLFRKPFCIIGRSKACDLVVSDPKAFYRHIYLQLIAGRWFFVNLALISKSTTERGQPKSGWFEIDRQLQVGPHMIKRVPTGEETIGTRQIALANAGPSDDLPFFNLEILNRAHVTQEPPSIQFCAPITLIGASPGCDLFLNDHSVSKVHASLVLTPGGLWVVDLLGRGGVLVDGNRRLWAQVYDGAVLQIGRFRLRVRLDSSRMMTTTHLEDRLSTGYGPLLAPGALSVSSLSEGAMLTLVGQLVEMQNQFFEQSRLQMQWMAEMMAHVGRAQQESARRDLARIEEITGELREIRTQLAEGATRPSPVSNGDRNDHLDRSELSEDNVQAGQANLSSMKTAPNPEVGPGPETVPETRSERVKEPVSSPAAGLPGTAPGDGSRPVPRAVANAKNAPPPSASSEDTHAWLTQRMASLSQEHTSVWRRLMNTLAGTPNP
jgi:hypothetical protein